MIQHNRIPMEITVVDTLGEWPSSLFSDIDVGHVVNRASNRFLINKAKGEFDPLFSTLFHS